MAVRYTEREARELVRKYPHLASVLFPTAEPLQQTLNGAKDSCGEVSREPQPSATNVAGCLITLVWLAGIAFGALFLVLNLVAAPLTFILALVTACGDLAGEQMPMVIAPVQEMHVASGDQKARGPLHRAILKPHLRFVTPQR